MALFLSSGLMESTCAALLEGGYPPDTPAAVVYKASWPEQKVLRGTIATIAAQAEAENIHNTALILICCSMAAWYIARVNSKFCKVIYTLCIFSMTPWS